jgi:2-phosphoglycerate kinase
MTVETHAIILNEGEDVIRELFRDMESGELMTQLTSSSFTHITIKNLRFVRMADPQETGHRGRSIWVEVTVSF